MSLEPLRHQQALRALPVTVAGETLLADPAGALFHEGEGVLIIADLHLEKGSAFARRAQMLPPYDTRATLKRLSDLMARYGPRAVACLGDSFHDGQAAQRLDGSDRDAIMALTRSVEDWIWVEGNHDPVPPVELGGRVAADMRLGALTLRHIPTQGTVTGELAGHLHPCAKVRARGRALRRRCFAGDGARMILPAFGAYAGGLNLCDSAFSDLFRTPPRAFMLGRDQVWPVAYDRLCAD